jgi:hypothetical protein
MKDRDLYSIEEAYTHNDPLNNTDPSGKVVPFIVAGCMAVPACVVAAAATVSYVAYTLVPAGRSASDHLTTTPIVTTGTGMAPPPRVAPTERLPQWDDTPVAPDLGSSTTSPADLTREVPWMASVRDKKEAGDKFRDEMADTFKQAGYDVEKEVPKDTPFGPRVIDIEVSKNGKVLGGVETKLPNARYRADQRSKDEWLRAEEDYPVHVVRPPRE